MATEKLSYTESVKDFDVSELELVFQYMCKLEPDVKDSVKIEQVCSTIENDFSSHTFKTISTKNAVDGCQYVKNKNITSPGMHPKPDDVSVIYPYMRYPTQTKFFKVILSPIKVGDVSKSLFDHIIYNDENTPAIFKSFKNVFGVEIFEQLVKSIEILKNKTEFKIDDITTSSGYGNIPMVFVPVDGEYVQVTPLSSTYNYATTYRTVGKNKNIIVDREFLSMSSKVQNIYPVLGPTYTQKLKATFPKMLSSYDAEIYKHVQNGTLPDFKPQSYKEFSSKIDGVGNFYKILEKTSSQDVKDGMHRLIKSIVIDVKNWYAEVKSYIEENYPEQVVKPLDVLEAIMLYTKNNKDHNIIISRIDEDGKLEKAMKEI